MLYALTTISKTMSKTELLNILNEMNLFQEDKNIGESAEAKLALVLLVSFILTIGTRSTGQ